ncbi:MAG: hypothetical protein SV760_09265 [Halobacteria archaeon]|nr:hypothetical protein [Halobacteria archaeon]
MNRSELRAKVNRALHLLANLCYGGSLVVLIFAFPAMLDWINTGSAQDRLLVYMRAVAGSLVLALGYLLDWTVERTSRKETLEEWRREKEPDENPTTD